MDEKLRNLERLAMADPAALPEYLAALLRTGFSRQIEGKARLGDPEALARYLQLLDYQGILELEHLWICPFFYRAYDFQDAYQMWPYDQPFMPPIKYQLGMTLKNVDNYYQELYEYGPRYAVEGAPTLVIGAFVVDVFDLEAADHISRKLQTVLTENLQDVARNGAVSTPQAATAIARYAATVSKYHALANAAILVLDRDRGAHFPEFHEIDPLPRGQRSTFSHLQDIHRDEIIKAYEEARSGGKAQNQGPNIRDWWPHRQIRQLPVAIFPDRTSDANYVVVVHVPTFRGFSLAGGYSLLKPRVTEEEIHWAMRYNRQVDQGWLPTSNSQMPEWAWNLPKEEFVAYWIAE